MAEEVTYYEIVDNFSSRDAPAGCSDGSGVTGACGMSRSDATRIGSSRHCCTPLNAATPSTNFTR
jgi:hypothetical protein